MSVKKTKKIKRRKYYIVLVSGIATMAIFALLFFILWQSSLISEHKIYVSSEKIKQGDTILIKLSGKYLSLIGHFDNEKIDFFRSGLHNDWFAYLGVDAAHKPGKYIILVESLTEKIEKEIEVLTQDFPSIGIITTQELKEKGYTDQKIAENIRKNDNPILGEVLDKITPEPYFKKSFSFPVSPAKRSGLSFGQFVRNGGNKIQHFGVDLRASLGTEVHSVNDGKVVMAKELKNYGKTIIVDHGLGIFSLYLHLDEFKVQENQIVERNQIIGLSGNTGYSTAPHLHFSMRDNGARIDPISFIKTTQETDESFNLANISKAFGKLFK